MNIKNVVIKCLLVNQMLCLGHGCIARQKRLVEIRNFQRSPSQRPWEFLGGSRRTVQGLKAVKTMVMGHKLANKIPSALVLMFGIFGAFRISGFMSQDNPDNSD